MDNSVECLSTSFTQMYSVEDMEEDTVLLLAEPLAKMARTDSKQPLPHTRLTCSHSARFDRNLCLFCQRIKHNGSKKLSLVDTEQGAKKLKELAESRNDQLCLRISGVSLIGARYHGSCRAEYVNKKCVDAIDFTDPPQHAWDCAFSRVKDYVDEEILLGARISDIGNLCERMSAALERFGITDPTCTNKKLKAMLIKHYGQKLVFCNQNDRTKSQLVYSAQLSVTDVVVDLKKIDETLNDSAIEEMVAMEKVEAESESTNSTSSVLHQAALILRGELQSVRGIDTWPPSSEDITNDNARSMVSQTLVIFLATLLFGSDPNEPLQENMTRQILSIGQDMLFVSSNGRKLTPKHVALGNTIHQLGRSKQLLKMVNRFGHCISHDQVMRINTAVASQLQPADPEDVLIPDCIQPNVFTQIAADNNDMLEETIDGKNTTHCTNMVVIQRSQEDAMPGFFFTKRLPVSRRERSLQHVPRALKSLHRSAHRASPQEQEFCIGKMKAMSSFAEYIKMDAAWLLSRRVPQKLIILSHDEGGTLQCGAQCVPGWTAFNSAGTMGPDPQRSVIGYCPVLNAPSTDYNVVYTMMDIACRISQKVGQEFTVLVLDQAIYSKALEIALQKPREFPRLILRLGGFHILLSFLAVIGKRMEHSGLEDILIESGVFAEGSVAAIMNGRAYNRAVRAHKLAYEALQRLQLENLDGQMDEEEVIKIHSLVADVRKNFAEKSFDEIPRVIQNLCDGSTEFLAKKAQMKADGRELSPLFIFWDDYLDMLDILMNFIRAERTGNWDLHKSALASMLPYYFAYDRQNYARYATQYLASMESLSTVAPEVNDLFQKGEFVVARSRRKFAQISVDQSLEQTINRDTKTSGGIVGFSLQHGTVQRWMQTAHYRASVLSKACAMVSLDKEPGHHKELGKTHLDKHESDVQCLIDEIKKGVNPFTLSTVPLQNLKSGQLARAEVAEDLLTAKDKGQTALADFINNRLNQGGRFYEPIKRKNLKTFASAINKSNSNSKHSTPVSDRGLFARLVIIAQSRKYSLPELFGHELMTIPLSIATADGCLRKTDKSQLMKLLQEQTMPMTTLPNLDRLCVVFDLMALVQASASIASSSSSFGDFAEKLLSSILARAKGAERIDIVMDRYDNRESIKQVERDRRTGGIQPLVVHIHGPQTPLPRQWNRYMTHQENKSRLAAFLQSHWLDMGELLAPGQVVHIAGCTLDDGKVCKALYPTHICEKVDELASLQEEADTRIAFHAYHAATQGMRNVVVHSPDTDVLVICLAVADKVSSALYFCTGTGDKRRNIDITKLSKVLGKAVTSNLVAMHALSGCDTTSAFYGIGKKTSFATLGKHGYLLDSLGIEFDPSEEVYRNTETFVVYCYSNGKGSATTVNTYRYMEFLRSEAKNQNIPPCQSTLRLHIQRANYQAAIWKRVLEPMAIIPSPIGRGWDENLQPVFLNEAPAPKKLMELQVCTCKRGCCTSCRCKKNSLSCTPACGCGPDTCASEQSDSEDETEDDE